MTDPRSGRVGDRGETEQLGTALNLVLRGRRIKISRPGGKGDFLQSYALLHRRVWRAMKLATDAIESQNLFRKSEGYGRTTKYDLFSTLEMFLNMINRVSELFEFYLKETKNYLSEIKTWGPSGGANKFSQDLKSVTDLWVQLANRCKHDHHFLVPVEGFYQSGEWVSGFALYQMLDDRMMLSRSFHKHGEVFSYNSALREILRDVMAADNNLALFMHTIPEDETAEPIDSSHLMLPYIDLIRRHRALPLVRMPGEYRVNFNVALGKRKNNPYPEPFCEIGSPPFTMKVLVEMFYTSASFELPYQRPDAESVGYMAQSSGKSGLHVMSFKN